MSKDPARAGNNWMAFAANNPIMFVDPTGLDPEMHNGNYIGMNDTNMTDGSSSTQAPRHIWSLAAVARAFSTTWDVTKRLPGKVENALVSSVEGLKQAGSILASQAPVLGDIKDIQEILTGTDLFTGKQLSGTERVITGIAATLPFVTAPMVRKFARSLSNAAEATADTTKMLPAPKGYTPEPNIQWPDDGGILGEVRTRQLQPGTRFDRYGLERGTYVSPEGTPFDMRSLPANNVNAPYNVYEVSELLIVDESIVAPWFNQRGLGTQYQLPDSVGNLVEARKIKRITE